MIKIESSAMNGIEYKDRTLTVFFKDGRTHDYPDTPKELVEGMLAAASAGSFFNKFIRNR